MLWHDMMCVVHVIWKLSSPQKTYHELTNAPRSLRSKVNASRYLHTIISTSLLFTCIEELTQTVSFVESPVTYVGKKLFCREFVVCILKHCTRFTKCHETRLFHFQDTQKV